MKSGLYLVSTPIGNMDDITYRAIETLKNADMIACEDTRVSKKLLSKLGINKPLFPYHDYNEEEKSNYIINLISEQNKSIALISDAGCPLISDPGYKLVAKAKKHNIEVTSIPGASAVITAMQVSGLPSNKFFFAGFISNKEKARFDEIAKYKNLDATIIFYETAKRIKKSVEVIKEIYPNREICIARELTKLYEETINGTAEEVLEKLKDRELKGEIVLLISPPSEDENKLSENELFSLIEEKLKSMKLKSAVKEIVEVYGLNKNEVYELALKIKNEKN